MPFLAMIVPQSFVIASSPHNTSWESSHITVGHTEQFLKSGSVAFLLSWVNIQAYA